MKPLSSSEEQFIEQYTSSKKKVGDVQIVSKLWPELKNPKKKLNKLLKDERIIFSIEKFYDIRRFKISYNEKDILDKLWTEANREDKSATHASRVNALVWLGKHIGMWKDKELGTTPGNITYNIINYSEKDMKLEKKIIETIKEEKLEEPKAISDNIKVVDYSE